MVWCVESLPNIYTRELRKGLYNTVGKHGNIHSDDGLFTTSAKSESQHDNTKHDSDRLCILHEKINDKCN